MGEAGAAAGGVEFERALDIVPRIELLAAADVQHCAVQSRIAETGFGLERLRVNVERFVLFIECFEHECRVGQQARVARILLQRTRIAFERLGPAARLEQDLRARAHCLDLRGIKFEREVEVSQRRAQPAHPMTCRTEQKPVFRVHRKLGRCLDQGGFGLF